ncbi:MAG: OmpA family protein [Alphaproteobacteria bacterium]|nr:OmpA family protein [Alphaproteobacteria bacterium]
MNFKKTLLAAAAVVALPVLAQAQPVSGIYLGAGIGGNYLDKTDIVGTSAADKTALGNLGAEFSWGYAGVLSLGWGYGNGLRTEIEGSYRSNDVSDITSNNTAASGATGTATSFGAMLNVLYDFDLGGALGGITPYVGAGLGYVWHEYDEVGTNVGGTKNVISGDNGNWGGQAIIGLSLPISSVPGLAMTAEYRYMMTSGHEVSFTNGSASNKVDVDNVNHSLLVGLRYAFNAAPAVAAAAPVAAARTFLVFFDWSKADLTDRARQIIGEAASARGTGVTRIEVNGFTDRSGPADYNMQLSIRRANAVAAELVRRGVPRNEIVTRGFGEENNLVPTADGVREPQNRRVEIILK